MSNKKRFCEHCGEQLKDELFFRCFDKKTGEKLFRIHSTCPNKKFYNGWFHTEYDRSYVTENQITGERNEYYTLVTQEDFEKYY